MHGPCALQVADLATQRHHPKGKGRRTQATQPDSSHSARRQAAEIRAQLELKNQSSLKSFFVKADKSKAGLLKLAELEDALKAALDVP